MFKTLKLAQGLIAILTYFVFKINFKA